jgi:hypothetical protein
MRNTVLSLTIAFMVIVLLFGCKGDKGPTGPMGNANVKSFRFTVTASDWNYGGTRVVYYDKATSLITNNILDNGTVILYYELSAGVWVSLPNSFYKLNGTSYSINYACALEKIEVVIGSPDQYAADLKLSETFKAIIIDGTTSLPKINYKNYEEVRKALNLIE